MLCSYVGVWAQVLIPVWQPPCPLPSVSSSSEFDFVILPAQDPAILPVRTLRDSVITMRCHPGSRTLTPSLPCPRGCLSAWDSQQKSPATSWRPLAPTEGVSPCWAAVENKKVRIIACIKSAQDGDLRRAFKTSWPPATRTPPPTV